VFSVDGGGDAVSAKAFRVRDGRVAELSKVPSFDSLGAFYSYITQICGFKAGRHEGKITGLAAHGEPKYVDLFDSLLTFRDGGFVNVGGLFFHSAVEEIRRRLPEDFDRADLSASVQAHAERLVLAYVSHWLEHDGSTDVALAGGLFGNVRINQKVHELPNVQRCFVHPGMSDAGMGVGAALAAYYESQPLPSLDTSCLEDVYLGPSFTDAEIEGAVVARFDGRMEYGPRALGNRSILYRPDDPSVNDWLNEALGRTEFMPFAPATLAETADRCFIGIEGAERTSRFMTITFDCTPWMKENCPGVVHVDGTARPQVVRREDNPSYYRIIEEYGRLTGVPVIINTSFNMHEEPIVCSPKDALRAFILGHLDYLAIGPFLVKNPKPTRTLREEPVSDVAHLAKSGRGAAS
jgi:carbamoyltransferase